VKEKTLTAQPPCSENAPVHRNSLVGHDRSTVIPAKAGIQSGSDSRRLDPRLRGDDGVGSCAFSSIFVVRRTGGHGGPPLHQDQAVADRGVSALLVAALLATAFACLPLAAQVEEEDLDQPGVTQAVPPAVSAIDLAPLEAKMAEAVVIFGSADQPSALPFLAQVIDPLEALGAGGRLDEPSRQLLATALSYRAQVLFNQGETDTVAPALERLLEVDASYELDPAQVSPKLLDLFQKIRARKVGQVGLVLDPPDAVVAVDGRQVADPTQPLGLLAGRHQLAIGRPGHECQVRELEVQAGKVLTLEISLPRKSAVLRLHTKPQGAAVFIDGVAYGETAGTAGSGFLAEGSDTYRKEEFSAELVVDNLEPGLKILEVKKPGFRPYRAQLPLDQLIDYPMPPIVLEPESGQLNFNDFPAGAKIAIDGKPVSPDIPGASRPQITLAPGEHHVLVSQGPNRMFSTRLLLSDRQTVEVNVKLRPGFAFLGVLGADRTGADSLALTLRQALESSGRFTVIEPATVPPLPGLTVESLRAAAEAAAAGRPDQLDWKAVQASSAEVPALLYALAVLSNDLVANEATLWVWAASPGPARPDRLRIAVGESAEAERVRAVFERRILLSRPTFGALAVDSTAAPHPVVIDVTPESPAGRAGVLPGDLVIGIAGVPVQTRAQLEARLLAAESGETLDLAVQSPVAAGGARNLQLTVGTSPNLIGEQGDDEVLPALAYAQLALLEEKAAAEGRWVIEANQAFLLLRAGDVEGGVRKLRTVRAPQASHGVGQAAIDYSLGLALLRLGDTYREAAVAAFERAAKAAGARLGHHDGPYLQPRAATRLEELRASP
jgi:hypothetical protein